MLPQALAASGMSVVVNAIFTRGGTFDGNLYPDLREERATLSQMDPNLPPLPDKLPALPDHLPPIPEALPALPEALARDIEAQPDANSASTQLSKTRTRMSVYRTSLSMYRTRMSMYRTSMSGYRTHLSNLRSHMSNERTHLSYLRTTVSLIGFGITLNRFSIFLQQDADTALRSRPMLHHTENAGIGMVVLGLLLLLWSSYRYWRVGQDIERGEYIPRQRGTIIASAGLLVLGGLTALWLFLS